MTAAACRTLEVSNLGSQVRNQPFELLFLTKKKQPCWFTVQNHFWDYLTKKSEMPRLNPQTNLQEKMAVSSISPAPAEKSPASISRPQPPKWEAQVCNYFEKLLKVWLIRRPSSATHLSNQCYTMCIRREAGFCAICYVATRDGINDNANNQQSFGLGYVFY